MYADKQYTVENLEARMRSIMGIWHRGTHQGNDSNTGNTLESLLGISENNLRIPDFGKIEIKVYESEGSSLLTLFHKEPLPRATVPKLLKACGWKHQEAGKRYKKDEKSFRSTTYSHRYTVRGFTIGLTADRIEFVFNPLKIGMKEADETGVYRTYGAWFNDINGRKNPHFSDVFKNHSPHWDRAKFSEVLRAKLDNTLCCIYEERKVDTREEFKYIRGYLFSGFLEEKLEKLFGSGDVCIDFDARTRHNHGTKLRIDYTALPHLFAKSKQLF